MELQVIYASKLKKRNVNAFKLVYIGPETKWSIHEQFEKTLIRFKEERTRDCCKNLGWFVDRGEMPIELGASWFSAKAIMVVRSINSKIGKALINLLMREQTNNDFILLLNRQT